jgi:hypothetical protein
MYHRAIDWRTTFLDSKEECEVRHFLHHTSSSWSAESRKPEKAEIEHIVEKRADARGWQYSRMSQSKISFDCFIFI